MDVIVYPCPDPSYDKSVNGFPISFSHNGIPDAILHFIVDILSFHVVLFTYILQGHRFNIAGAIVYVMWAKMAIKGRPEELILYKHIQLVGNKTNTYTVKNVRNDLLYSKIYWLWCVLMQIKGNNLLLLTISAFWSSFRWPRDT